jgi:hypothetical protein
MRSWGVATSGIVLLYVMTCIKTTQTDSHSRFRRSGQLKYLAGSAWPDGSDTMFCRIRGFSRGCSSDTLFRRL